jgi:ureidoglycolate lyase
MDLSPHDLAHVPTTGARRLHVTPLVEATEKSLEGYGALVADPRSFPIEIVRWPAQGWRPVDENSGNQGGITEGIFEFWWKGEILFARNNAVGDSYLFGWSNWPEEARAEAPGGREHAYVWRANYHPDGGQLIYPLHGDGSRGLYVHPNVWHGAFVPLDDHAEFLDRQGRVHARVSVDFQKEFGCYLAVPLRQP